MLEPSDYRLLEKSGLGHLRSETLERHQNSNSTVLHVLGCTHLHSNASAVTIMAGDVTDEHLCQCWVRGNSAPWWTLHSDALHILSALRLKPPVPVSNKVDQRTFAELGHRIPRLEAARDRSTPRTHPEINTVVETLRDATDRDLAACRIHLRENFSQVALENLVFGRLLQDHGDLHQFSLGGWEPLPIWEDLFRENTTPDVRRRKLSAHYGSHCKKSSLPLTSGNLASLNTFVVRLESLLAAELTRQEELPLQLAVLSASNRFLTSGVERALLEVYTLKHGSLTRLTYCPQIFLDTFTRWGGTILKDTPVSNPVDVPWETVRGLWSDEDDNVLFEPEKLLAAACSV